MVTWLHSLGSLLVASSLATTSAPPSEPDPAQAGPTDVEPSGETEPGSNAAAIAAAEDAWGRGEYLEVRGLLEPIADSGSLTDRVEREKVLVLLADATLSDETLPNEERQLRATAHLGRLMDTNPQWQLPRKVYSPELHDLYLDVIRQRLNEAGAQCEADKLACEADADAVDAQLRRTQRDLGKLQQKYDSQEVAIGEKRTRALALFPFGISHFLNGDRAIGAVFLATEATLGIAGLSLLIVRATVDGCRRTRNFQAGSLKCDPRNGTSGEEIVRRRKAEEAMGWVFIGAIAFDIVLAQIRFKAFEITDSRPRSELENEGSSRRRRKRRRATVRPKTSASPWGASLGLEVRF